MRNTINVGIIGLGRAGQIHLKNLTNHIPGVRVIIASDSDEKTHQIATMNGVKEVTTNAEKVAMHPDVDAVIIACPTHMHIPYSIIAVNAGKHVFCEKPLDVSIQTITELEAAVDKKRVKLMVGFNRRFDSNFARIHQLKAEGKIGTPHLLKITSRDPAPPPYNYIKTSGGLFIDMAIHDFDMARFIVGSEISEVFVKGDTLIDPAIRELNDIDTAITLLTFENGSIGVIDNSRKAVYGYDQRLEIFGSEGMLQAGNNTPDNVVYYNQDHVQSALPLYFFLERYENAFREGIKAFINCIQHDLPSPVSCKDGKMATAIAIAAGISSKEKRTVSMSEILI